VDAAAIDASKAEARARQDEFKAKFIEVITLSPPGKTNLCREFHEFTRIFLIDSRRRAKQRQFVSHRLICSANQGSVPGFAARGGILHS